MQASSDFRKTETFKMISGVAAALVLGFGTATAAIGLTPADAVNPAARPLSSGPSLRLEPAFGSEDEDCVYVTAKSFDARGKTRIVRKLECAE